MNFQLDENVWFGDWSSPIELKDTVKTIVNVAHHFSKRRERNVYWQRLEELPWDILYVRIAKKDHDNVDDAYFDTLEGVICQAIKWKKLPILCHCQMGAHRGPTTGIMAAWILNGRTKEALDRFIEKTTILRPKYARSVETPFRKDLTEIMRRRSV